MNIDKGEFVFLVGPSGAGKTTLMKLIFREVLPTSGTISFQGKNVTRFRPRQLLEYRRNIGMVFQDFRLLQRKTVWENVSFALEVVGKPRRVIQSSVPGVLEQVGLAHKHDAFPTQLSAGEQQRVGIARAIVRKPQLILADEPTGNVDPDAARGIMELFEEINLTGTTIIIATHAWGLVEELDKRVISLEEGRLVSDSRKGDDGAA